MLDTAGAGAEVHGRGVLGLHRALECAVELGARKLRVYAVDERGAPVTADLRLDGTLERDGPGVTRVAVDAELATAGAVLGPLPACELRGTVSFADGLSMPHSPRVHNGKLWLLNAGTGHLGYIDAKSGKFEPVTFLPGYARGLTFHGDYAIVGLSKQRREHAFRGSSGSESH